jgi:hypothetical protein
VKLYLDQWAEAQNILVCGTTGTMKSSCLRGFADQARARGWPIIFLDKKRDYLAEYYRPGKDHILNIGDKRCSIWALNREADSKFEARPIANSMIPYREGSIPFFTDNARSILAFLIGCLKLPAWDIVKLIRNPSNLEDALYGSGYEGLLSKDSVDIRNGLLGNLGIAIEPLSLLPRPDDENPVPEFCIKEWAMMGKKRQGDIFLSSTPDTFKSQKDLQTLILDLLILRMQTYPGPGLLLLDEIGIYGKVPELENALAFQRSTGNVFVLAFQAFSQMADNYNIHQQKSIISNPAYKVVLGMSHPDECTEAAKLLALEAELERVKESVDANQLKDYSKKHHSYSSERPMVYPVMPGQVKEMVGPQNNGKGWLAIGGHITPVQLSYRPAKQNQPDLVPRVWPAWVPPEKPKEKKKADLEKRPHKQDYTQGESPI